METPWISFRFEPRQFGNDFWILLGEAKSKCEHLANVPLPPEEAEKLHQVNIAKGVQATTAIEGNLKSLDEIREIMLHPATTNPTHDYQEQEIRNVLHAYNEVIEMIQVGNIPNLSLDTIKHFNKLVLDGIATNGHIIPGEFRQVSVVVGAVYRAPDWSECGRLLSEMCMWLNGPDFDGDSDMKIPAAIIKASLAHLYVAWIHPFGDGNGRTARLCEYLVLVSGGVPSSAAHLISNHCNETRDEYYRQLDFASKSGGDVTDFLRYCVKGFVKGLTDQLDHLYMHHLRIEWKEYVAQSVTGRDVRMRERRSLIAEALLFHEPVSRTEVPLLSSRLTAIYTQAGPKTLVRDLNELERIGLIRRKLGRYEACTKDSSLRFPVTV